MKRAPTLITSTQFQPLGNSPLLSERDKLTDTKRETATIFVERQEKCFTLSADQSPLLGFGQMLLLFLLCCQRGSCNVAHGGYILKERVISQNL